MSRGARNLLLLALPLALQGCLGSPAPNAAGYTGEQQAYYDYFISQGSSKVDANLLAVVPAARQIYFDDKKCLSYGAKPGSDAYVACRAQLDVAQKQPVQVTESYGGGSYEPAPVPASNAPALQNIIPPTTRCQSVSAGLGTVQTVCR